MGFYVKRVLPHLLDLAMRNKEQVRLRAQWIPHARGEVLEVGIGSGLNLPFYSQEVQRLRGVDPSLELQRKARKRAGDATFAVEFLLQSAEDPLPIASESIDTVVVTWTLCSIANASRALLEMRRVLRPDGRLIFLEHGHAPDPRVALWQDRITPIWKHIAGGCTLNRKMDELITAAGFHITELATEYMQGPRPMTYMYKGFAQPA
jgi:ubiquinone/menaquinone biosynthesis C-methylase UbiE